MRKSTLTKIATVALGVTSFISFNSLPSYAWGWGSFGFHHPRRAEVLHRDSSIGGEIARDPALSCGQKARLRNEDRAIHNQEQAEAAYNGGYITKGEQAQLNHEENHLQSQINRDSGY